MATNGGGRVESIFPIIATPNLERSLAFYRDLLGATIVYGFPGPNGDPVYVGLDIGVSHPGIGTPGPDPGGTRAVSLWVYTDDCAALVERMRAAGVTVTEEPTDQPWGERTARVLDPDGNEVIVGT